MYRNRWRELRASTVTPEKLVAKVDKLADQIGRAEARDQERWATLGTYVWPTPYFGTPVDNPPKIYADELELVREFIRKRIAWMDEQFAE